MAPSSGIAAESATSKTLTPMKSENNTENTAGSDCQERLVRPLERVRFANGLEATLQDDGTLRIMSTARGLRGITIYPSSDNSCRIGVIGKIHRANSQDRSRPLLATETPATD
jgi:hypothetical protein